MHPEAVDACVLRVAPVGQDPKLHDLICGHLRGLSGEEGFNVTGPLTCHQQKGLGGPDVSLWGFKKNPTFLKFVFPGTKFPGQRPWGTSGF